ncbi:c-type cytochrome [Nevskia soli]|uniref:c-type cytochrome n=1 Tax=Nevskia soli TaxID=418856 RepID=UPI00068A2CDD|nr:c-type cytochrome [Nevskia soli]
MANRIQVNSLRLVSMVLFAAVLMHRGAEAAELKVCVDKSNPASRMDVSVATAVGRLQGDTTRIVWFDGQGDGDDGISPRRFHKLTGSECQLVLGFPVDVQDAVLPEGVHATSPYARTGFVLVTRKHAVDSLDRLPKDSVVAVTYMTAPNLYFADHPGLSPLVFANNAGALHALDHGDVAAAMLWRPYIAQRLHGKASTATMSALDEPHAKWNLVALYGDASEAEARRFEQGIEQLRQSGALKKLLQPYADVMEPAPAPAVAASHPGRFAMTRWPSAQLLAVAGKKQAANAKVPPALYTPDQAEAGKQSFQSNCAVCHGPTLEGRAGPALKGPGFANPQAKFSVGDVFQILSLNMPAPAPGTLPHEDYVNIMAFILQQNGYPAGASPLTFEAAGKSKVKLLYRDEPAS